MQSSVRNIVARLEGYSERALAEHAARIIEKKGLIFSTLSKCPYVLPHEKDDYFQEVFIHAYSHIADWQKRRETGLDFGLWIIYNVRTASYKYRRRLVRKWDGPLTNRYVLVDDLSDINLAADEHEEEDVKCLYRAVEALPAESRKIVRLYLDGAELTEESKKGGFHKGYYSHRLKMILNQIRTRRAEYFEGRSIVTPYPAQDGRSVSQLSMDGRLIKVWRTALQAQSTHTAQARFISVNNSGKELITAAWRCWALLCRVMRISFSNDTKSCCTIL